MITAQALDTGQLERRIEGWKRPDRQSVLLCTQGKSTLDEDDGDDGVDDGDDDEDDGEDGVYDGDDGQDDGDEGVDDGDDGQVGKLVGYCHLDCEWFSFV